MLCKCNVIIINVIIIIFINVSTVAHKNYYNMRYIVGYFLNSPHSNYIIIIKLIQINYAINLY